MTPNRKEERSMRNKTLLTGVVGITIGVLLSTAVVFAGSLNPTAGPADPSSQMYDLQQIYDRLTSGAVGTKMTTFAEPAAGPAAGTMRTLDEVMAAAPAVDTTKGATTANVASGKTFWGLTSGQWGLQTGAAIPSTYNAGVPRTGQTTSYAAGDDGALRKGVAWPNPRFTDNGDGTVTDNLTGLIWLKNANCIGSQVWRDAIWSAQGLANGSCGLADGSAASDWRLPNLNEMLSIMHFGVIFPAVPNTAGTGQWTPGNPFTGVQNFQYWTSTTTVENTLQAKVVTVGRGDMGALSKALSARVWPVRGGQ
jgi:hypothetical protein